ncbi:replicative DNA helicase [Streptomyces sp. NPDC058629]|uniref:replicative DNA helicase n=1 Tax=Streptomyces sp. NPDC058629 TaxID=3346565 RepID=UPI0036505601
MTTDMWATAPVDDMAPDATPGGPSVFEDERIIAASVMARPDLIDELAAEFDPADIQDDRYRWVWNAVDEIRQSLTDDEIRWQAVNRQLQAWKATGYLPMVPLALDQLARLYDEARPNYSAAAWHAQQITKASVARRCLAFASDMKLRAQSAGFDPDVDIAAAQDALDSLTRQDGASTPSLVGDLIGAALERAITPPTNENRIPTGFMDLDALLTGGFAPGQLVVIAARPAIGKSTLGLGLARAAAIKHGIPALFESLEMGDEEMTNSILAAEARIGLHHIKQGTVDDAGMARAARATPRIAAAPLYLNDSSSLSLPILRGRVRHMIRTLGLRIVFIDYLQLMDAPKAENRQAEVSKLTRGLKLMAKEFGIAIVILAQLNRGPEQRQDKKPMVSDLRESGAIEQDADIVILLHREDAYDKESARAGEADFIVGKHRAGPTGTITTAAALHYASFLDMAAS